MRSGIMSHSREKEEQDAQESAGSTIQFKDLGTYESDCPVSYNTSYFDHEFKQELMTQLSIDQRKVISVMAGLLSARKQLLGQLASLSSEKNNGNMSTEFRNAANALFD